MTEAEILEFQKAKHNTDWWGKPLSLDGKIGPKTQWAMDITTLPEWRQSIIRLSLSECAKGIIETPPGSNRSKDIDKYIAWCGLDPHSSAGESGYRWCAAAASYALSGGSSKPIREAGVKNLAESLIDTTDNPLPGDIAYIIRSNGTGHVGILLGINATHCMINEGNSNNRMEVVVRLRSGLKFASIGIAQRVAGVGEGIPLTPTVLDISHTI